MVGTWINQMDNSTLVINSDGTGVVDEDGALYGPGGAFTYGVAAGKMIIIIKDRNPQTFDFFISNDGRTLILTVRDGRGILFRKKN
ncbi:hypothetical protein AGMMS50230_22340 [Spirochaetia bacterium]|nr:hypothetical protein AGMMS50230_22340 [Spirochaetia bacterium]